MSGGFDHINKYHDELCLLVEDKSVETVKDCIWEMAYEEREDEKQLAVEEMFEVMKNQLEN